MLFYFNSIKVQLKPDDRSDMCKYLGFQFHKGTIKTTEVTPSLVEDNISIP